jgi:lipoyl(octanoyl) transferase
MDYLPAYEAMQAFTAARTISTANEIWLTEHPPVITLGTNAKPEHVLNSGNTPVIQTDRGGQVTWHGPGQLMVYLMLDLKPLKLTVKGLVQGMESAAIELLASYGITARCRAGAPGVYVGESKIASLGVRVKHGCCYHGMAINVCNEADAFAGINPCGYPGLTTTNINDLLAQGTAMKTPPEVGNDVLPFLLRALNLSDCERATSINPWRAETSN